MSAIAILLCAGYGTRMGALTAETPKPLLEVAGRPLLDYLLDQLRELPGLDAVHVVTNHRHARAFAAWGERRPAGDLSLELHDDGSTSSEDRLGAIGDLDFLVSRLGAAPDLALVAAGDNILRFALAPFWQRARDVAADAHVLALLEPDRERLSRTGVLELDGDRVRRLHEKPEDPPSRWACPACYVFARPVLEEVAPYLRGGGSRDEIGRFVADVIRRLDVRAFRLEGERLHVGHPAELERAEAALRSGPVILSGGGELPATGSGD